MTGDDGLAVRLTPYHSVVFICDETLCRGPHFALDARSSPTGPMADAAVQTPSDAPTQQRIGCLSSSPRQESKITQYSLVQGLAWHTCLPTFRRRLQSPSMDLDSSPIKALHDIFAMAGSRPSLLRKSCLVPFAGVCSAKYRRVHGRAHGRAHRAHGQAHGRAHGAHGRAPGRAHGQACGHGLAVRTGFSACFIL